jgi:DNA-binding CsgD family transcriptional regulator/PAS domain-containing protein
VLSSTQLHRLESASRALLNPLAAPTATAWMQEAGSLVRDFIGGERVVVISPSEPGRYQSEDAPEVADGVGGYIAGVTSDGILFTDPVIVTWYRLRQQTGQEVLSWDQSRHLVETNGHRMLDSPIVADVLHGQRYNDFAVLVRSTPIGDAMIWALHGTHGGFAFGEHTTAVLGTLLPSFRAGLDALLRFGAHRHTLDAVSEPLAAFDADGRLLHCNTALTRLLDADPERDRVDLELRVLARHLRALAFPLRHEQTAPPTASRETTTGRGCYVLRGLLLPPTGSGFGEAVLVSVALDVPPALPDPEAVRTRHGLTKREAEVALLLAEGRSNADLAERLFVSPHTARHHVENVLSKLGLTSRAAVAARLMGAA